MAPSNPRWSQHSTATFWVVTFAALAVRLVHIIAFSDPTLNPAFIAPVTDAGVHHRWAQQIIAGLWPGPQPFFRAPLYPYFLAGLYQLFSPTNPLAVQIVHGIVSALGAGFAALCARHLWDEHAAWGAGLLFATLGTSIYYAGELLAVTLSVTLNLIFLWLLLAPYTRRRLLLCGMTLGLSAISRPTVLVITPVVCWYLWHRDAQRQPGRRARLGLLAAGLILTIAPVSARNLIQGGEPVFIAASGGVNFYIGNNQQADGRVAFLPGSPPTWQGEMSDVIKLANNETNQSLSAQQADRFFWRKGLNFWRDNPAAAAHLFVHKAWLLLAAQERSNNKNLAFWYHRSPVLCWPWWPEWAFILGLAVLGLKDRFVQRPERWLLIGICTSYAAALLCFFINARFRLPVMAWLVIPAGAGLNHLWLALRRHDCSPVPRSGWILAALITVASVVPDLLTFHQDPDTDFESWRSLGNSYAATSQPTYAMTAWRTALEIDEIAPKHAYLWTLPLIYRPLADMYRQRGQLQQALTIHRKWISRLPDSLPAQMGLADILLQTGDPTAASALLANIVRENPTYPEARLGYGWSLSQTGQDSLALPQFEQAAQHLTDPNADYGLGVTLSRLGRHAEATAHLEAVTQQTPRFSQAWEALANNYAQTGQTVQARRCWQRVLALNPGNEEAKRHLHELR